MKRCTLIFSLTLVLLLVVSGTALSKDFTIGLSNGWVGSEWRTQMIDEAKEAAAKWKTKGVDVEVIVYIKFSSSSNHGDHGDPFFTTTPKALMSLMGAPMYAQQAAIAVQATDRSGLNQSLRPTNRHN